MISRTSAAGSIFANMAKLKAGVIKDANKFAKSKGKVTVPVNMRAERPVPGFPLVEYQFKLVNAEQAQTEKTTLQSQSDRVTENTEHININLEKTESKDTYSELLKLEDLRKRGILTEEEFTSAKKRLLSN